MLADLTPPNRKILMYNFCVHSWKCLTSYLAYIRLQFVPSTEYKIPILNAQFLSDAFLTEVMKY